MEGASGHPPGGYLRHADSQAASSSVHGVPAVVRNLLLTAGVGDFRPV